MKTSPKTTASPTLQRKPAQPFFQKGERGSFWNQSSQATQPKPFFSPSPTIQAKLTVGQPNDPYEQEADQVADHVVQRLAQADPVQAKPQPPISSLSAPASLQSKCANCEQEEKRQKKETDQDDQSELQTKPIFDSALPPPDDDQLQRKCAHCEQEEKVQRQAEGSSSGAPTASSSVESQLSASRGGGSSLPADTRQRMESAMGADFSGVRVHTGGGAVQMSRELNAQAFTHGRDIYFNSGKYDPGSVGGQRLLAHELTHTVQQGGGAIQRRIQLSPESDLIDTYTSWGNLDEDALGQALVGRIRTGEYNFIQNVINTLGRTDRDDVSYEFARRLNNEQLDNILIYEPGRRLLDRMFDELTSGSVAEEEQRQADRIIDAKSRAVPVNQFPTSLEGIKIFPFRTPGMTVFNDAPMSAERRASGRIWIKMPVRVLGTDQFRGETRTLPEAVFTSGLELPENEIIGVRLYDLGNVEPVFKPALFLVQLANETDTAIASTIGEVVGIGLTLGVGELVVLGVEASMAARVLLWSDRAAFILGTLSTIINEHRGWILSTFGESGRNFLYYNSLVQRATAIYGMGRMVFALGSLLNNFRKSFQNWRVAADGLEEVSAEQQSALRSIDQEGENLFNQTDEMQNTRRGTDSPEGAPSRSGDATTEVEGPPRPVGAGRRIQLPEELASTCVVGSINCRVLPQRILDEIEAYPETVGGFDVPFPSGEIRIMRSAVSGVDRNTALLRRAVLGDESIWSPRFRAALARARSRNLDWPVDSFGQPWEVHHVKPVSMGGSNLPENLLPLPRSVHQQYTVWWNSLLRRFRVRFSPEDWAALVHNETSVAGSAVPARPVR